MKRHRAYLAATLAALALLGGLLAQGREQVRLRQSRELAGKLQLVRSLGLTDLAIWSEARYTRHPSQADHFTPFQEFPGSLEHFPAGSILAPPRDH
ncbi:hypothetical protein DESUT3_36300 [Desulfuromonas versatilis]|uniref:Uncharacterized protein n=1 Tax=Desulfuromonas versatilis TaxID=2802975 RepID=A0ABN6E2G6_9BACT|nr:hypothetical protein [Desulfuromonas versatilis]BCR06561.1 hypothetical protein DESUT3_36300 [Desulfuromonas versatilis]